MRALPNHESRMPGERVWMKRPETVSADTAKSL